MTPDPLDTLKYVVLLADLLLSGNENAEQFLDDLDWLTKPYGVIGEDSTYRNGSPIVVRRPGRNHYSLPPGFVAGPR